MRFISETGVLYATLRRLVTDMLFCSGDGAELLLS